MNLKTFDSSVLGNRNPQDPSIGFGIKGRIGLNRKVCEIMDLNENSRVLIVQNEDRPQDWYITKTTSEKGFVLKPSAGKVGGLNFSCQVITSQIMKSCGIHSKYVSMLVAQNPSTIIGQDHFAILTASAKFK